MNSIDLNSPPPGQEFSVSVERVETNGECNVLLFKDVVLFVMALVFVSLIVWPCFHTLDSADSSADAKRWALLVFSAATGGLIGKIFLKIIENYSCQLRLKRV